MEFPTDIGRSIEVLHIKTQPGKFEFLPWVPIVHHEHVEAQAQAYDPVTRDWERSLVYVPDLLRFGNCINLKYRRLFHMEFDVSVAGSSWIEDYWIYKCLQPRGMEQSRGMAQPKNRFCEDTNAYGVVFVFTLNRHRRLDRSGNVRFGSMEGFARSVERLYPERTPREVMMRDDMRRTGMTREQLDTESLVRVRNVKDMLRY